jgi:hypothetical protein
VDSAGRFDLQFETLDGQLRDFVPLAELKRKREKEMAEKGKKRKSWWTAGAYGLPDRTERGGGRCRWCVFGGACACAPCCHPGCV